jgi:uncharacterized protein (DUF736 family)
MTNDYLKNLADGFGSMHPVTNKKNDKQPDYQGWVKLDGQFYEIAGWIKFGKTNNKFLSISVKQKNPENESDKTI